QVELFSYKVKISKLLIPIAILTTAIGIIFLYYSHNPAECAWMPKCPSKLLTGYDCPACGAQRALHSCLHGDFVAAWHFNPFLFIALPYLLIAIFGATGFPGNVKARRIAHSKIMAYGYVAFFLVWWIVRNL
ncbi:MAG: DUF2752 domain-containing protein, partial [Muribaculaceae bacterium]|nr:DUF2752 domain-containing protein [Muribaculaceae bacterium]